MSRRILLDAGPRPLQHSAVMSSPYWPFVTLAVSVAFIIIGISKLRLHAFIALLAAALIAGLMTGRTPGRSCRRTAR